MSEQNDVDSCRDELIGKLQDCFAYPENAVKMVSRFETAVRESMRGAVQPPATPQEPDAPVRRKRQLPCPGCVWEADRVGEAWQHASDCRVSRASTPSLEGQTWQPIETCTVLTRPLEDRKRILVYGEMGAALGWVVDYGDGTRHVAAEGFNGDWRITHWMPLPSPPTPEGTQP